MIIISLQEILPEYDGPAVGILVLLAQIIANCFRMCSVVRVVPAGAGYVVIVAGIYIGCFYHDKCCEEQFFQTSCLFPLSFHCNQPYSC